MSTQKLTRYNGLSYLVVADSKVFASTVTRQEARAAKKQAKGQGFNQVTIVQQASVSTVR